MSSSNARHVARPADVQNHTRVVATHPDYPGAQRVVDALADQGFPVGGLAIVGANLQSFEQITGRRGLAIGEVTPAVS